MDTKTKTKTEHYTDTLYYDLEKTVKIFRYFSNAFFKKLDLELTSDEFITLDTILYNSGICQRDLAKLILRDRAATGRILDSLESKKLITRFVDIKNNRLVRKMGVTEEGKVVFDRIQKKLKETINKIDQNLVPEEDIEHVRVTLKKIRDNFKKIVDMQI